MTNLPPPTGIVVTVFGASDCPAGFVVLYTGMAYNWGGYGSSEPYTDGQCW